MKESVENILEEIQMDSGEVVGEFDLAWDDSTPA
jgi:hypothetical protein